MPSIPREPPQDNAEPSQPTPCGSGELPSEDFYYEGSYLVFTASYHLKRGSCCHSDCRHCPYRESA